MPTGAIPSQFRQYHPNRAARNTSRPKLNRSHRIDPLRPARNDLHYELFRLPLIRSLQRSLKEQVHITTIYVTHDKLEALALSDRIVVMNKGKSVQIGTPEEIYERPADPFVADFIGTSSCFRGTLEIRERYPMLLKGFGIMRENLMPPL